MLNVVKVPDDASGGGGFFSRLVAALKAALGLGDGAPSSLRARMSGHANRGIGGWWTKDRMGHAVDRLMKEAGLSREGAAGLVARWSAIEASGGPTSENANGAFGIGQWLDRRAAMMRFMRVNHLDPRDYDAQLSWAIHELNGSEGQAAAVLRGAHSALEGARGASMYERAEGYSAGTGFDAYTAGTPVWKVLRAIAPSAKAAPASWDVGPAMNALNAYLPVGPSSVDHSRSVSIGGTTNNITVNSPDPQSAAAMVGVHLDRTANDISRNLQGAFQ